MDHDAGASTAPTGCPGPQRTAPRWAGSTCSPEVSTLEPAQGELVAQRDGSRASLSSRGALGFLTFTLSPDVTIEQQPADVLTLDRMDIPGTFPRTKQPHR